ncbi:hypothetical protein AAC387_Pa04g2986 [Persea americana]
MTENENNERSYYMSIGNNRRRRPVGEHFRRRSFDDAKHFPPPMPLLTHSGSLPAHMPWFFKRSYTDNGRLVLQEVKAKHHQFFCARRVNGRLTLRLMHSSECSPRKPDDLIEEDEDEEHEQEQEQEGEDDDDEKSEDESGKRMVGLSLASSSSSTTSPLVPLLLTDEWPNEGDLCLVKKTNKEMSRAASSPSLLSLGGRTESPPVGVGGGGGVCFPIRRTGSLLKMSMPTIRPVHS